MMLLTPWAPSQLPSNCSACECVSVCVCVEGACILISTLEVSHLNKEGMQGWHCYKRLSLEAVKEEQSATTQDTSCSPPP